MKTFTVFLALTLAAADKPIKVETWHDQAVDFSVQQTFDFDYEAADTGTGRRGRPPSSQGVTRAAEMRTLIVTALERRGYRHAPDDDVDFLVLFRFNPPQRSPGRGGGRRSGLSATFAVTWGKGNDNALYVELREPDQRLPIWRGTGLPVQVRNTPITPRLTMAVDAVFDAFPPSPHTAPIDRQAAESDPATDGTPDRPPRRR